MSVKLVLGGASFGDESQYPVDKINEALDLLKAHEVKEIDTAAIYQQSEMLLGKVNAASRFNISTKYPGGFTPKPTTTQTVVEAGTASLVSLQTNQVDVYYIHAPDRRASLEEMLAGINTLYKAGKFRRFGLSNFLAAEVEEVIRIAKEKSYVLPTVYQGNYNAVGRLMETELLPTLRKHNIAFYAYSPIAGGFLTKDVEQILAGGQGRWDPNSMVGMLYNGLYNKPGMLDGLHLWEQIAKEAGIPKAELAYRWVVYHSALKAETGDAVIFGSRNNEQLGQTLEGIAKGPLASKIASKVEEVWKVVEAHAPLDNFNSFIASKSEAEFAAMVEKHGKE